MEITQLINAIDQGDAAAADELLPLLYEELRRFASVRMARERPGHTLQATALVHEVWIKLSGNDRTKWRNRSHFFAAAAEAMRRILIDHARRNARQRHGGGWIRADIERVTVAVDDPDDTVLAVNEALEKLESHDPLKARIVKLRYFTGMSHEEIAGAMDLSEVTVRRHWAYARSWLFVELKKLVNP